jgi:16S rRNA processing protein RimM
MAGPAGPSQKHSQRSTRSSGSEKPELRYLAIGKIVRAHGVKGEISVKVMTEFPERFEVTRQVYLGDEFEAVPYELKSYRWHKDNVLLTLTGVTNRNEAETLRGQLVQVPIDEAMPLPDGVYYHYQLVGLEVVTTAGKRLGELSDVMETGANDVYIVKNEGKEILLPAIAEVVKSIDLEENRMTVEVIAGLI